MNEEISLPTGAHRVRGEWPVAGMLFALVLGSLIAGNWNVLTALVSILGSEGYWSEFLVLIIATWLLWLARHEFAAIRFRADWRGLLLVAPVGAGLLLADLIDLRAAQFILMLFATCGAVWCILGAAMLRVVAYPIAFLLLALPVWDYTRPLLQDMTVRVTELVLETVGVPVFVDETYISIPSGTVVVLAACSGSEYLHAGVMLGALFAYLNFGRMWTRMAVVALFGMAVILGNWIRVLIIMFLGSQSGFEHSVIGWVVFVLLVLATGLLSLRLQRYGDAVLPSRRVAVTLGDTHPGSSMHSLAAIAALTFMLLVATPLAADRYIGSVPDRVVQLRPLQPSAPWSGPYEAEAGWRPLFANAEFETLATYRRADREVALYAAFYGSQYQGAEAVNEHNKVYDPENWVPRGGEASGDLRRVALDDSDQTLEIVETQLMAMNGSSERLVWHWFRVAGRDVAVPWRAKVLQILGLTEGRDDAAAIVLSTGATELDYARESLGDFLNANFLRIDAMVQTETHMHAAHERPGK